MVGKGTFGQNVKFLSSFRRMPTSRVTIRCVDLNSASIYSSYNFIL